MSYYLIFGITYATAAALQPGPLQTYILSQVVKRGWRATLPTAFAPLIADIPILIVVFFVFNKLPPQFLNYVRIAGGLFLFYLAYKTFLSCKTFTEVTPNDKIINTFWGAVTVNLLNPHPYIGWSLILGPMFFEALKTVPINAIVLIVSFYSTMTLSLIGIIFVFSIAKSIGPKISKSLLGLSAIGLFLFGVFQIYKGIIFFI